VPLAAVLAWIAIGGGSMVHWLHCDLGLHRLVVVLGNRNSLFQVWFKLIERLQLG